MKETKPSGPLGSAGNRGFQQPTRSGDRGGCGSGGSSRRQSDPSPVLSCDPAEQIRTPASDKPAGYRPAGPSNISSASSDVECSGVRRDVCPARSAGAAGEAISAEHRTYSGAARTESSEADICKVSEDKSAAECSATSREADMDVRTVGRGEEVGAGRQGRGMHGAGPPVSAVLGSAGCTVQQSEAQAVRGMTSAGPAAGTQPGSSLKSRDRARKNSASGSASENVMCTESEIKSVGKSAGAPPRASKDKDAEYYSVPSTSKCDPAEHRTQSGAAPRKPAVERDAVKKTFTPPSTPVRSSQRLVQKMKGGSQGVRSQSHGKSCITDLALDYDSDPDLEGWGTKRPGETSRTCAARIAAYMKEYEEAGGEILSLQERLQLQKVRAQNSTPKKRQELNKEIRRIRGEIRGLVERRNLILENGGAFKEKLINEQRFKEMRELKGGRKEEGEEEEDMESCELSESSQVSSQFPTQASLQAPSEVPSSGIPAQQVALPDTAEESSEGGDPGGMLRERIIQLESPLNLQSFAFGDDPLPERGRKQKAEKASGGEWTQLVFEPLPGDHDEAVGGQAVAGWGSRCCSPVNLPDSLPGVEMDLGNGENRADKVGTSETIHGPDTMGGVKRVAVGPNRSGPEGSNVGSKGTDKKGSKKGSEGKKSSPPVGEGKGKYIPEKKTERGKKTEKEKTEKVGKAGPGQKGMNEGVNGGESVEVIEGAIEGAKEGENEGLNVGVSEGENEGINGGARGGENDMRMEEGEVNDVTKTLEEMNVEMDEINVEHVQEGNVGKGMGEGAGPPDPPAASAPLAEPEVAPNTPARPAVAPNAGEGGVRSYASVAAGGSRSSLPPRVFGNEENQRRFLEALKKGEESVTIEGREVPLSFWTERHGLSAFRERRSGEGDFRPPPPTTGPGAPRRNVVRLKWVGKDACPQRSRVVELLLGMEFRASDIFALIHPFGSLIFDVSFVRVEGLELFWSRYEARQDLPEWRDFDVQAISRQNNVKRVTVLTSNESLSYVDIMTWLGRYGEVMSFPTKNRDEYGIWSGAWTFLVKLKVSGNTVTHIPSSTFLGRDRILVFYQGQPKVCHRCGDPTHLSAQCRVQKCALCGGIGHLAASCDKIRCNLCGMLGHPFSRCPLSVANAVSSRKMGESTEAEDPGEGTSRGDRAEEPVTSKRKSAAQMRRKEARRRAREGEPQVHAGGTQNFVPEVVSNAELAEAPGESDLEEETRRIEREEEDALPAASYHSDSGGDESGGHATKRGAKKGKNKGATAPVSLEWDHSIPLTLGQMPEKKGKEGTPPLIDLSNKYAVLVDLPPSGDEEDGADMLEGGEGPSGSGVPSLGKPQNYTKGAKKAGEGKDLEASGGRDNKEREGTGRSRVEASNVNMDVSVCLKRLKPVSSEDEGGIEEKAEGSTGKKKAVELDHQ